MARSLRRLRQVKPLQPKKSRLLGGRRRRSEALPRASQPAAAAPSGLTSRTSPSRRSLPSALSPPPGGWGQVQPGPEPDWDDLARYDVEDPSLSPSAELLSAQLLYERSEAHGKPTSSSRAPSSRSGLTQQRFLSVMQNL
jgi:hypothetical protein